MNRSDSEILKEIILVDDFSSLCKPMLVYKLNCYNIKILICNHFEDNLGASLDEYMKKYNKVKILRLQKREGLIRARLAGNFLYSFIRELKIHTPCEKV